MHLLIFIITLKISWITLDKLRLAKTLVLENIFVPYLLKEIWHFYWNLNLDPDFSSNFAIIQIRQSITQRTK